MWSMQCLSYVVSRESPNPCLYVNSFPGRDHWRPVPTAQHCLDGRRHVTKSQTCIRSILILPQEAAPRPRVTSQHQHVCAQASIIAELATHGFLSHNAFQESISCPSRTGPSVMSRGRHASIENTRRVYFPSICL